MKPSPEEIRAKLEAEAPDMLKFIDDCRKEFGAKVTYLKCGDMEIGRRPRNTQPPGTVVIEY